MAESVTRPDINATQGAPEQASQVPQLALNKTEVVPKCAAPVIWTPRFIVLFLLVLTMGLSLQSVLTMVWSNHIIQAPWVLIAHMLCITSLLLALICTSRSWWLRAGGIFGCIWTIFSALNQLFGFVTLEPFSPIPAYLNAIMSSALLGSYTCFSLAGTPLTTWDKWFFRITLGIGVCATGIIFFVTVATGGAPSAVESGIAALELVFSVLVWWLRPTCWQIQPGPTFLFGLTPTLTLLLTLTSLGKGQTNFFLNQVALFACLLATLRLLQGVRRHKQIVQNQPT